MSLPTPYCLGVKRRQVGAKDERRNPVITYADPVDWWVHGYSPGANAEPANPNRDLSVILWTVYAPGDDECAPTELDRVVLNGTEYAVEGRPGDFSNGPWENPIAGVTIELKAVEG